MAGSILGDPTSASRRRGALGVLLAWVLAATLGVISSRFATGPAVPVSPAAWPGRAATLALAYGIGLALSLPTAGAPHGVQSEPALAAGRPVRSSVRSGLLWLLLALPLLVSAAALLFLAQVLPWLSVDMGALFTQGLAPLAFWLGLCGQGEPGRVAQATPAEVGAPPRALELVGRVVLAGVRREPVRDA